jgi:hypothetical protein
MAKGRAARIRAGRAAGQPHLVRLMDGYLSTQLLYAAARLGIADTLDAGPLASADLAERLGADPRALHRVLRGLVLDGVLREHADGRFALTPAGRLLRRDAADSVHGAVIARGGIYYGAAAGLVAALQRGGSAFEHVHGMGLFEYLAQHTDQGMEFQHSMVARSRQEAAAVVATYDFGRFRQLVDVGGGYGVLLTAILGAVPTLRGVLFDRPVVAAQARERLGATGFLNRCEVVAGDFLEHVPAGGDAYLLSRVIHDWDDQAAVRILANCRTAMRDGATLLLIESVMGARARQQPGAVRMDLHMLTLLHGCERTAREYEDLLRAAGLHLWKVTPVLPAAGLAILEAAAVGGPARRASQHGMIGGRERAPGFGRDRRARRVGRPRRTDI